MTDAMLLKVYACENSQEAFAELVSRHADWVYSASLRMVRDRQIAEDVCQAVFLVLARKAAHVRGDQLAPWLFRVTRYSCNHALRAKNRRERHERKYAEMMGEASSADMADTWERIAPLLDEMVHRLSSADRMAILLRFYQQKKFVEVGQSLGIREDAARKRVDKSLQQLRRMFAGRGVVIPGDILPAILLAKVSSPPSGAVLQLCQNAITASARNVSITAKGAITMMLSAKMKIAATVLLFFGLVPAGAGVFVLVRSPHAGKLVPPVVQPLQSSAPTTPKAADDPQARQRVQLIITSARNLRLIGLGLLLWSNENRGKYPPDLGTLIRDETINVSTFVNPARGTKPPANLSRAEQAKWVDAHSDYIYVGAGLDSQATSGPNAIQPFTLLAYEKATPGFDGINILYGDVHVEFDTFDLAEKEIAQNAKARQSTATSRP